MTASPEADLSDVLQRVVQRSEPTKAKTRRELANDATTRTFLEAGLRLLAGQHGEVVEVEDGDARRRPFFDWLSVKRVRDEVTRSGVHVTENDHRYRWPSRDDFIEDLLAYSLWEGHWPDPEIMGEEMKSGLNEGDLVAAIHKVAYENLRAVGESMTFRVGMIAAAMAKDDPLLLEASTRTYDTITENWSHLYQTAIESRGLALREGITLREFTMLITALADGLSLRMSVDPESQVIDHEKKQALLGKGALAMALAYLDPGDGASAEDLARLLEEGRNRG